MNKHELLLEDERLLQEKIAADASIEESLGELVEIYEAHAAHHKCALFMTLSGDNYVLNPVAGTNLTPECREALMNLPVTRDQSASGRAAYFRRLVSAKYIRNDLRTRVLPGIAHAEEQVSGFALPILSSVGRVLGTFCAYGTTPGQPNERDLAVAERVVYLAAIALQPHSPQPTLIRAEQHGKPTRFPDRTWLHERVTLGLLHARRERCGLALLFINIDGMHHVNEFMGHEAGDCLLRTISGRLRELLPGDDTLICSGGDEFVLLLENFMDEKQLVTRIETLLAGCSEPMNINGQEIAVTVTAGVAQARADVIRADELLHQAYIALQHAKSKGHGTLEFYSKDPPIPVSTHISLAAQLRHALERGEFQVHYQPQVDLQHGRIVGAEALLRWCHPELGPIPPMEFVPVLEESGLINPVNDWLLDEVGMRLEELRNMSTPLPRIAINVSARQFRRVTLATVIDAMLVRHHLPPCALMLELTETLIMHDIKETTCVLQALHEYGVHIAVDDFGTGYSSLSYLKHLPLDMIKIDKKFMDEVTGNCTDAAIVGAIIMMAHNLNIQVVAEGVEEVEQLDFLRLHSCDQMQGYLFSKPLPFDEFRALVASRRRLDLKLPNVTTNDITIPDIVPAFSKQR
ncbi:MAG: GGDEF domain-containing protein [Gammaproteobacteria bacterium]